MPIELNPYLTDEILSNSKLDKDPIIVYLIVRESLNMGAGKIAAQVGHGIQMLMATYYDAGCKNSEIIQQWIKSAYRKVVLRADDKQFERIKQELDCFLVIDAGLTQISSGSETVICLWPQRKSCVSKLISRLQLLK